LEFSGMRSTRTVTTRSYKMVPLTTPTPGHNNLARTPYSIFA
jgi:hypothetical protein